MTPTCPKCKGTDLRIIQNPKHGMFVMCQTTGCFTYPVVNPDATLYNVLVRYEGAVSEVEREGNDSEEAVAELAQARAALLALLRQLKEAA
jgi:hypothetical protein